MYSLFKYLVKIVFGILKDLIFTTTLIVIIALIVSKIIEVIQ